MKKALLGLFSIAAILTTGCLGNSTEQVLGIWNYVQVANPSVVHPMTWTFNDNGTVFFYDNSNGNADTGTYEMYMNGTHRIIKIKGTTIKDPNLEMEGEWDIVDIDFDKLIIGTRDHGGFQQRDFVR